MDATRSCFTVPVSSAVRPDPCAITFTRRNVRRVKRMQAVALASSVLVILCLLILVVTVSRDVFVVRGKVTLPVNVNTQGNNFTESSPMQLSASRPVVTFDDDDGATASHPPPLLHSNNQRHRHHHHPSALAVQGSIVSDATAAANNNINGNSGNEQQQEQHSSTLLVRDYVKVTTNDALVSHSKIHKPVHDRFNGRHHQSHYNRLQPIMAINGFYYGLYPVIHTQAPNGGFNSIPNNIFALNRKNAHPDAATIRSKVTTAAVADDLTAVGGVAVSPSLFPHSPAIQAARQPLQWPSSRLQPPLPLVELQTDAATQFKSASPNGQTVTTATASTTANNFLPIQQQSHQMVPNFDRQMHHLNYTFYPETVSNNLHFNHGTSGTIYTQLPFDRRSRISKSSPSERISLDSSSNYPPNQLDYNNVLHHIPNNLLHHHHHHPHRGDYLTYSLAMPHFCHCLPKDSKDVSLIPSMISGYIPVLNPPIVFKNHHKTSLNYLHHSPTTTSAARVTLPTQLETQEGKWCKQLLTLSPPKVDEEKESIHVSLSDGKGNLPSSSLIQVAGNMSEIASAAPVGAVGDADVDGDGGGGETSAKINGQAMGKISKNSTEFTERMNKESIRSTRMKDDVQKVPRFRLFKL